MMTSLEDKDNNNEDESVEDTDNNEEYEGDKDDNDDEYREDEDNDDEEENCSGGTRLFQLADRPQPDFSFPSDLSDFSQSSALDWSFFYYSFT